MRDKHQIIEEPCEVKVSCTVLETSESREGLAEFNLLATLSTGVIFEGIKAYNGVHLLSMRVQLALVSGTNPDPVWTLPSLSMGDLAKQSLFNHLYLSITKKITFVWIKPAPYSEVNPSIDQSNEEFSA